MSNESDDQISNEGKNFNQAIARNSNFSKVRAKAVFGLRFQYRVKETLQSIITKRFEEVGLVYNNLQLNQAKAEFVN